MAGTPQYVDVSAFQGAINWQEYKTWAGQWDGISRVVMKSTEGTGYTDPRFHEYRAGALAAGINVIGYYHYARPEWNSAEAEATWQQSVVGAIRPQDFLMLDYESDVPQATAQWALTWLAQQDAAYGRLPTIYSYPSFIAAHLQDSRLARYPLTYADWQFTPTERPPAPAPWKSYEYLQWSDNATVPGIGSGVDIDLFLGGFSMQSYGPNSADFNQWFTAQDADHWLCKQNGHIVQYGIKGFFSQLSIDGNTLPVVGLPITNEIYLTLASGKQVVLQAFERAGIYYDPAHLKDHQPGTGDYSLCHLTDQDFLKHVPGLAPLVAKALAEAKKL